MRATDMKTEWKAYYRDLAWRLECPRAKRRELIEETRRAVTNFMEEAPHVEFADAVRFIGTPAELARSYNELLGPEATEKFRRGRRIRRRIVLGFAIVALAAAVIYGAYLRERQHDVNITEEKTIVIYKTEE